MASADRTIPREAPLPYHPSPPIAPGAGLSGGERTRAMVEMIIAAPPASDAEALKALRLAFPQSPLGLRVAALSLLMRGRAARARPDYPHMPR